MDARCEVLVLMLGDQPGVTAATVAALLAGRGDAPIAACGYTDGRGHPLAFSRDLFGELRRCTETRASGSSSTRYPAVDVAVDGPIPPDVDAWEDYEAALRQAGGSPRAARA